MTRDWTPAQRRAIETEGATLLVSAAAGSGKTAVLVERIVSRIVRPDDPYGADDFLVVTFTEAASAQMRRRIAAAIADALRARPEDAHLQRQLALLPRSAISTLHAFCKRVLRRFFHRSELDPGFVVLAEHEALLLREDVLDEVLERYYASGEPAFCDLVDRYGGERGDRDLRAAIERLYEHSRSMPFPERWLAEAAAAFEAPGDLARWAEPARQFGHTDARAAVRLLARALGASRQPGGPAWLAATLEREHAQAARTLDAFASGGSATIAGVLGSLEVVRAPAGSKAEREGADPELCERVLAWRKEAHGGLLALRDGPLGDPARVARAAADLAGLAGPMQALVVLVGEFAAAFRQAKRRRHAIDFHDLEHMTLDLLRDPSHPDELVPSDVALALRGRFRAIMVDEYQDTNPVQEAILGLIARPAAGGSGESENLFMVGDAKQSIYRFRLADPSLFLRRAQAYPDAGPGPHRIDLQANFRSRGGVVTAVNHVFRAIMSPEVGEIAYDARAELRGAAAYPPGDPPVEVHLLGADPVPGEYSSKLQREAAAVAVRVAQLLAAGLTVQDGDGERPLRRSDIAILLRAANAHGPLFCDLLAKAGVPAHAHAGTGYFEAAEVVTMLSLLDILDNPRQDIPLAAVLRSPIGGLAPADLARIRLAHPTGEFYDAVVAAAAGDARVGAFLDRLAAWRTAARRSPLSELVWRLLTGSGYLAFSAALPGGVQRKANLLALYDRAREFDHFTRQGLFRFLRFMRRLQEAGEDLALASPAGEGADVVRVMSIHRSKGLEFPVVVVAGLGQRFNFRDVTGDLLIDRDIGLGPRVVDPTLRIKYPSWAHRVVADRLRRQTLAEEMRVLYVAMTRARERLLLFGTPPDPRKWEQAAGCESPLPPDLVAAAAAPIDWIGMALAAAPARDLFEVHEAGKMPAPPGEPATGHPQDASPTRLGSAGVPPASGVSPEDVEATIARLSWAYPYAALARCPAKVAASHAPGAGPPPERGEAPHPAALRPALRERPRFVQADAVRLTAAERGTATHLLMQHVDFVADATPEALALRLAALVEREILAPEAARGIDSAAILAFLQSSWGKRLALAQAEGRLAREVAFSVKAPAFEIQPDLPADVARGEWVLVQGMIDALVLDADGLIILDYKTDEPAGRAVADLALAHGAQMGRYRDAAAAIFGRPIKQACLVFLATGVVANA